MSKKYTRQFAVTVRPLGPNGPKGARWECSTNYGLWSHIEQCEHEASFPESIINPAVNCVKNGLESGENSEVGNTYSACFYQTTRSGSGHVVIVTVESSM